MAMRTDEEVLVIRREEAEKGDMWSQNHMAVWYIKGKGGLEKDEKEAFKWWSLAAEQGLSEAQFNLGRMYLEGVGVDKDQTKGMEWWEKAAEQGHPRCKMLMDGQEDLWPWP